MPCVCVCANLVLGGVADWLPSSRLRLISFYFYLIYLMVFGVGCIMMMSGWMIFLSFLYDVWFHGAMFG